EQDVPPVRRPVGAVSLQVGVSQALNGAPVRIHDPYRADEPAPVGLESDLVPVGGILRHPIGPVAAQELPYARPVGVHHIQVAELDEAGEDGTVGEHDLAPVRGPGRLLVHKPRLAGQLELGAAVRVHDPDLPVDREHDPGAVRGNLRRTGRMALRHARELAQTGPVRPDGEDLRPVPKGGVEPDPAVRARERGLSGTTDPDQPHHRQAGYRHGEHAAHGTPPCASGSPRSAPWPGATLWLPEYGGQYLRQWHYLQSPTWLTESRCPQPQRHSCRLHRTMLTRSTTEQRRPQNESETHPEPGVGKMIALAPGRVRLEEAHLPQEGTGDGQLHRADRLEVLH